MTLEYARDNDYFVEDIDDDLEQYLSYTTTYWCGPQQSLINQSVHDVFLQTRNSPFKRFCCSTENINFLLILFSEHGLIAFQSRLGVQWRTFERKKILSRRTRESTSAVPLEINID